MIYITMHFETLYLFIGDAGARKASQDEVRATDFVTSFQKCKLSFNLLGRNSIDILDRGWGFETSFGTTSRTTSVLENSS